MLAFKGKALAVVLVTVMLSISVSPMIFNNQMGTQPQSSQSGNYPSTIFGSLQQYAEEHGTTVEQLTANWTADDWLRWYKYEGNPSWGSTNITDQFLATDWVKLPNSGNLTWGANYDYEYKYNETSDRLEMWHNGTLVSYLGSDDLWHYASDRPNLTDLHHMTDKEYVDNAVTSLGARYYMIDTSSGISDYKLTQLSPPSGSEQSVTKSGLADDDYIAGWISPDTSMSKLIKGVYNWHVYAEKTGGTQTLRLYWQLVERKSDNTETIIATSAVSNEILTSKESYIIPLTLSGDYTLADGSYIVGKLYADVSDGGSAPDVAIYYDDSSKSHWEIPVNLEIFSDQFLKLDGSNANSDIDISPYNLTVNNISAFNLKSAASYIIWTDGTTVYALNGSTGKIDYSGTDAATVIQNAIDSLPQGDFNNEEGGVIFIRQGKYNIYTTINVKPRVYLIGEGIHSTFLYGQTSGSDVISVDGSTYSSVPNGGGIKGMSIYSPDSVAIKINDVKHFFIDNIWFYDGDNGVSFIGAAYNGKIENCRFNVVTGVINEANNLEIFNCNFGCSNTSIIVKAITHIHSNWFEFGPSAGGKHIVFESGGGEVTGNFIGTTREGSNQIEINGGNYIIISDNYISGANTNAIYASVSPKQLIINDNIFDNWEGYAILFDVAIESNRISNNIFYIQGTPTGVVYCSAGRYIQANSNLFYSPSGSDIYAIRNGLVAIGNRIYRLYGISNTDLVSTNYIAPDFTTNKLAIVSCLYVFGNYINGVDIGVSGCHFVYNNYIKATGTDTVVYLSISNSITKNNYIDAGGGTGITVPSSSSGVKIIDNEIVNSATPIELFGSAEVISRNIGYTTENSGTAIFSGDGSTTSFSISHGLAATPSQVLVTPTNSSMASATWWVSAKTSTYFNITFSTAPSSGTKLSFDWYAEV